MISEDPYDPHPRIVVSPNEATPLVREERVISPRKDQPKELEEEDVESSTHVVELVELELPGTQPCNRPREETKKRTRSNSPNRTKQDFSSSRVTYASAIGVGAPHTGDLRRGGSRCDGCAGLSYRRWSGHSLSTSRIDTAGRPRYRYLRRHPAASAGQSRHRLRERRPAVKYFTTCRNRCRRPPPRHVVTVTRHNSRRRIDISPGEPTPALTSRQPWFVRRLRRRLKNQRQDMPTAKPSRNRSRRQRTTKPRANVTAPPQVTRAWRSDSPWT